MIWYECFREDSDEGILRTCLFETTEIKKYIIKFRCVISALNVLEDQEIFVTHFIW